MSTTSIDLHGKVITYNNLKNVLPDRDFFIDQVEHKQILNDIRSKKPLLFLPTYLTEMHIQDEKYKKALYKIVLMGVTKAGHRINVVLDGIEPYFEVRIPDTDSNILLKNKQTQEDYIQELCNKLKSDELTRPNKISMISAKPFKYYQANKSKFIRFYYSKTKNRQSAIRFVRSEGYETTSDDLSCYYRVVCRDYLTTFSSWAVLQNYAFDNNVQCIKNGAYRLNINDYKAYTGELTLELLKDKTLSCCWDIETWSKSGDLPVPSNKDDCIFCLSMTFQWVNQQEPFLKICLCDYPANAKSDYLTVVCGTELNIINAFGDIFANMSPEFLFGFNDSDYDWNWLVTRASQTKGMLCNLARKFDSCVPYKSYTDENVLKYVCKKERIKIEADSYVDGYALRTNGYIPVDVRTVFQKLYPTAEQSSLKWFLAENKLGGKEDMPYERLFEIYRAYRAFVLANKAVFNNVGYTQYDITNTNINTDQLRLPSTIQHNATHHDTHQIGVASNDNITLDADNKYYAELLSKTPLEYYEQVKKDLMEINYYCVVDAIRCHDLMKIRCVIMDHREISHLSYVSVYDAFVRANGMKVRNLTIAKGQKAPFNIRFSNITNVEIEDGKYPGAFVFPPKKGLKTSKLSIIERIQKAKLTATKAYPACQEWREFIPILDQNQQQDTILDQQQDITELHEKLTKFYDIINKYGAYCDEKKLDDIEKIENITLDKSIRTFMLETIGRPIAGLDFSSLYPSLIRCYNFSPEYCILDENYARCIAETGQRITRVAFNFNGKKKRGWFIWHNNKLVPEKEVITTTLNDLNQPVETKSKVQDPDFQFGVYPYILDDLFNKRSILKKQMKGFIHRIEEMVSKGEDYINANKSEYEDTVFNKNYLNSKQNALKCFMNTFYGEAGNKLSPFFIIEVAGGITTYGKQNIQLAYSFVKNKECNVYYGDTDSIYLSMPESEFAQIDKDYYTNKIDKITYWTKLVEQSFNAIKSIINEVNDMFYKDNGTKFLSMAYEEFLYPVAFTAKKKYFGIAHENIANFKPKDLFIRGLEVKKRGVSDLLRKIFMEIMWCTMDPNNLYTLLELVHDKIDEIYKRKWNVDDFIQTGIYRPTKNNVKITTFVKRMAEKGVVIKPNERFNYILVKKYPYKYDYRGRKQALSIGDKIELVEEAVKNNMEIDLDYYMQGSVNGQLARLVTYHDMFLIAPLDNTPEELQIAEDRIYKSACKYIDEYCQKYYAGYHTFGKTYQKLFKTINKMASSYIKPKNGTMCELLTANVQLDDFEKWFMERAEKVAQSFIGNYGEVFVKADLLKHKGKTGADTRKNGEQRINILQKVYYGNVTNMQNKMFKTSIYYTRERAFKETISILRGKLHDKYNDIIELYKSYHTGIDTVTQIVKSRIQLSNDMLLSVKNSNEIKDYKLEDFNYKLDEEELSKQTSDQINKLFNDEKHVAIMKAFTKLYHDLVASYRCFGQVKSIMLYLEQCKNHKTKTITRPPDDEIRTLQRESVQEAVTNTIAMNIKF